MKDFCEPTPNPEPTDGVERRLDEYIDDEEQDLLDAVAEAIGHKLSELGVQGTWQVDQDEDARTCAVGFLADFGEIEYPIVSDDGRRMTVVFRVDYIQDENGARVERQVEL